MEPRSRIKVLPLASCRSFITREVEERREKKVEKRGRDCKTISSKLPTPSIRLFSSFLPSQVHLSPSPAPALHKPQGTPVQNQGAAVSFVPKFHHSEVEERREEKVEKGSRFQRLSKSVSSPLSLPSSFLLLALSGPGLHNLNYRLRKICSIFDSMAISPTFPLGASRVEICRQSTAKVTLD